MGTMQIPPSATSFGLCSERLGPLPLINHFIARIGLETMLDRYVPTLDGRCVIAHAKALGVLLRSIIVEREPIYRQHESAIGFAPGAFGLSAEQMAHLGSYLMAGGQVIREGRREFSDTTKSISGPSLRQQEVLECPVSGRAAWPGCNDRWFVQARW
jgi:hypothetical protein